MHKWFSMDSKIIVGFFLSFFVSAFVYQVALQLKNTPSKHHEKSISQSEKNTFAYILDDPQSVTLYSIEPIMEAHSLINSLQNWKVLGKTHLAPDEQLEVLSVVENAVLAANPDSLISACFQPRHALTIMKDEKVYDILICFECRKLHVFESNKLIQEIQLSGTPDTINAILKKHYIELTTI